MVFHQLYYRLGTLPSLTKAPPNLFEFLSAIHPYDTLSESQLEAVAARVETQRFAKGQPIYLFGETLKGLYIIVAGHVDITLETGELVSILKEKNSFGERGLLRGGKAATTAIAATNCTLLRLPKTAIEELIDKEDSFQKFFTRSRKPQAEIKTEANSGPPSSNSSKAQAPNSLATRAVEDLMTPTLIECTPTTTITEAAKLMRDKGVSSLIISDGTTLNGIITLNDISKKVVAEGHDLTAPVSAYMTSNPITLPPGAIGSDVLHLMIEKSISHVPIAANEEIIGIVTKTDLARYQMVNSAALVSQICKSNTVASLKDATNQIPQLLATLTGSGNRHDVVTRLVTDIADAVTRRLIKMAEDQLGPPPVPYLWLACGSQGRQEQTGVSDQDNCLILDDSITEDDKIYFEKLAHIVADGLNECGFVYCPGDMMATNDRWRQPQSVWRSYFEKWISSPVKEAQMLASVMFDLRAISGTASLYQDLQTETLKKASSNSIFIAHMVSNSITHTPPLSLIRGIATLKSGEHKHHIDLKLNGVIPIVDLGRIYALQGQIKPVNTRARLLAAQQAGTISTSGAHDLLDAYDLIAETRLQHQARQIKQGIKPNNFMRPTELSSFERSHLRDAFVVVRTMQAAITQGRGGL